MKLTVEDVTQLFNVSEKTIYRWIRSNGLPAYRVNNQYRFNRTDLLEWAASHRVNVSPSLVRPEAAHDDGAIPSLADALTAGGIHYRIGGTDKASVMRAMVDVLRLPERVDREMLLQVLLAREEMGSTGIGDGIAIPHARNPIVLNVTSPGVTLCFLERPIDFEALDGKPVGILFTVVSPTIHTHLHLLSRITFALRAPGFREALLAQASRDEILRAARQSEDALRAQTSAAPEH